MFFRRFSVALIFVFCLITVAVMPSLGQETEHPRLWVRASDLPRLRAWAVDSNPLYSEGLAILADNAKAAMDAGNVPAEDSGSNLWEQYPVEMYAQLFAFMSLIENDPAVRDDYAQRARTLLMHGIEEAAKGAAEAEPFRDPYFTRSDRARWWGEGWALTVDWIYPYLSADDKALIREVFLRWADENMNADTTAFNHPEPPGVYNNEALISERDRLRWSANNYFLSHMRNLGLMALVFDPEDDPGGKLRGYLQSATGAWLYMIDYLLKNDARGGFSPEGWQYGPEALGYTAQFLLALYTSGEALPDKWGPQVVWENNPFWNDVIPAHLHSLSPVTVITPSYDWIGEVYKPAWFGDGQEYWAPDFIGVFGPLGIYDSLTGNNADRLNAIRWIQTHTPPGGEEFLTSRVGDTEVFRNAILYFLLFDPDADAPSDPHPDVPLYHYAEGIGRILARTGWDEGATWFTYHLGWSQIDHQLAEGNQFGFYRDGEWLTKGRVGWDGSSEPWGCNIGRSDYHNALALENSEPDTDIEEFLYNCYLHGSQWIYAASGDGRILAHSINDEYVYALGDATALYNTDDIGATDILHASRSIIWLKPDHILIYDRATSATEGRFKRFWLNTPTLATIDGNQTTATLDSGQGLVVTTILPTDADISAGAAEPFPDEVAIDEPMQFRILVEAPGGPADVRFLHVLQGMDPGAAADSATYISGDVVEGALVGDTAILFPMSVDAPVTNATFSITLSTQTVVITGLEPDAGYDVAVSGDAEIIVSPGSTYTADSGGVLMLAMP